MINAQQLVLVACLFAVDIPANMEFLLGVIGQIAAFEVIPTEEIYDKAFTVIIVEAFTPYFETIGLEHVLLFQNFGTLGFVIAAQPIIYITYYIMASCAGRIKCCKRNSRKLGRILFWNSLLRLVIESFVIGILCCLLNARELEFDTENKWTYANAVLTLIFLPIFAFFPIISGLCMCRGFKKLENEDVKEKYGELYDGFDSRKPKLVFFLQLDYIRKTLLCVSVVMFQDHFWIQMTTMFVGTIGMIMVEEYVQPRTNNFTKRMDIFNEVKLTFILYHLMMFTDFVTDDEVKFNIGYSCFAVVTIGLFVNMSNLITTPINAATSYFKMRKFKKEAKKQSTFFKTKTNPKKFKRRG